MASRSNLSYAQRAQGHANPLVQRLFEIAERKKTNIVLSADLTTSRELLAIADSKSTHSVPKCQMSTFGQYPRPALSFFPQTAAEQHDRSSLMMW